MPISIEADPTLAQGYIKVNGTTAATVTSNGLTTASLQDNAVTTAKVVNAAITPAKLSQPYTLATAQASTSGSFIDFTGIPSWARRITVMFSGVSTNGTSNSMIQIGAGSIDATSYLSSAGVSSSTITTNALFTTGFGITASTNAASTLSGSAIITALTSNTWVCQSILVYSNAAATAYGGGSKTLSGTLDRIRITTVNGTDTFDAGTINISYE